MRRLPSKNPVIETSSDARQSKASSSSASSAPSECRQAARGEHERDDHLQDIDVSDGYVELTLISAQGLKDVRMFGSMCAYAMMWIDPSCKHRTCVSENTGSSPVWDYYLRLPVAIRDPNPNTVITSSTISRANSMFNANKPVNEDDEEAHDHQRLTIQIFSQGAVSDVLVGTAHIPLQDIIQNAADKLQYLACQLVRPSGRIQGLVNLSVQYTAPPSVNPLFQHDHRDLSKLPQLDKPRLPGPNRKSWFFLSEDMTEEGTAAAVVQGAWLNRQESVSIAAPDYLDFKVDGEAGGTIAGGGASRSSSSANESLSTSTPHSPIAHAEFSSMMQQNQHQQGANKSMFDNTFDAMALADATADLTLQGSVSIVQGGGGAGIGEALLGIAMTQAPLQGDSSAFGPFPSS